MNKADPFGDMEAASDFTSADNVERDQPVSQPEEPIQADNVGALLCATRMRMAGDLQEIAEVLRIRYSYLVAIEDGRYEDLPGSAYSVGFVRAYADYLGLDGNEVVKRLRVETNGTVTKARFDFPVPSGESGLPNGGLLAIAVAMGVIVYGAWYTITNADRDAADLIQEMPSRIAVLIEDDPSLASDNDANSRTASLPSEDVNAGAPSAEELPQELLETIQNVDVVAEVEGNTTGPNVVIVSSDTLIPSDAAVTVEQTQSTDVLNVATAEKVEEEIASTIASQGVATEVAVVPKPEISSAVEQVPENPALQEDPQSPSSPEDPAVDVSSIADQLVVASENTTRNEDPKPPKEIVNDADENAGESDARIAESVNDTDNISDTETPVSSNEMRADQPEPSSPPSRAPEPEQSIASSMDEDRQVIELRAKSDSWIQVRDGNELLLTRLLREGEVYQVPDRDGLTLMTGNAGGLEVFVGGERMPPLGDVGVVKRGVPLSPERLRSGTAPG